MKKAQKFKQLKLSRQPEEKARLKVVKGPDYGSIFVLYSNRASIGRGETSDIMISDLKASRLHAELKYQADGWVVSDLGSSNGIVIDGETKQSVKLQSGKIFSIGETTLEFVASDVGTVLLTAPPKSQQQIQAEKFAQAAHDKKIQKITSLGGGQQIGQQLFSSTSGTDNKKPLVYGVLAVLIGILMFWDTTPEKNKANKSNGKKEVSVDRDLASFLPQGAITNNAKETAGEFFKTGFREFRERNFLRARQQFQTALQIDPTHKLSKIYLDNCEVEIKEEVNFHLDQGAKTLESGRLREAASHFNAITRLLNHDQSNPAFVEAQEQLQKVSERMKGSG